jgi:beta-lactamase regulating signal transducer with metallopeptidase domain
MALELITEVILPRLLAASVQSLLVVAVVLLVCKLFPRLSSSARAGLWWLVALQLVVGVLWSSPLALPLLPAESVQQAITTSPQVIPLASAGMQVVDPIVIDTAMDAVHDESARTWSWALALAWAWMLGLAFLIARTLRGYLATRKLLRESQACRDSTLLHALQLAAEAHGLRRTPELRLSSTIDSPQLIGPWRPVLLLPENHAQAMHADELDMALTHELFHLQRGDLWWGLLPAIAQHLFFFNPLAHYAAREYALAREAACDAAVVAGNRHCARDYGRLLVRLGVAPRPSAGLASASPTFHILKRRLVMLQDTATTPRVVALLLLGAVAVLGVMPYRITAATAPAAPAAPAAPGMPLVAPPAPPAVPGKPNIAPPAPPTAPGMPRIAPPAPPPAPTHAVPAPPAPPAPLVTRGTYTYVTGDNESYVMLTGDETYAKGSSSDMREAQRQRRGSEDMLWVRKGNARYVVRDPATLRKLQAVHDEMNALGEQQGRLGAQQGELGGQQGKLGARQAEIAVKASMLAAEQAQQSALQAAGVATSNAQAAQSERMAALEAQQRGMAEQMEFLGERQAALGREQAALGAKQAAASERASREANRLLEQAIKNGLAQPVNL